MEIQCILCSRIGQAANDVERWLCGSCVQVLLQVDPEKRADWIEDCRAKGREEAVPMVEKFWGMGKGINKRPAAPTGGETVRDFRKGQRLTQVQLADQWGVSQQFLQQIEAGKRDLPDHLRARIQASP